MLKTDDIVAVERNVAEEVPFRRPDDIETGLKVTENKPIDLTTQSSTIVLTLRELRDTLRVVVERWVGFDATE